MALTTWGSVVAVILFSVFATVVPAPVQAGPIHDAAKAGDAEQVERLIVAGADVNEKNAAFSTALHLAADAGHLDVVQVLVAKGADINAKDLTDQTPVMFAVLGEHDSILEFLIAKGGDVNLADSQGITALDDAIRKRYAGSAEILKRAGAKCGTNEHYSQFCREAVGSE